MAGNDSHIQQGEVDSLVEAIEELRDRIAELEAALRPFSDAADVAEEIRAVKIGTDEIRQLIESHRNQREIIAAIPIQRPSLLSRVIAWLWRWR